MSATRRVALHRHWPLAGADALRAQLLDAYSAPERHYHDLQHLGEVLDHLSVLIPAAVKPVDRVAVVLAAWFHDAVYDGGAGAEERSARWAESALPAAGVETDRVSEVARLVRLTEHHRVDADDLHGALLCDADLAILAADEARYADYAAAVRQEYAHVPDDAFAAGRAAILESLRTGPIFLTPTARERWEDRARSNLRAEIARLRG